MPIYEYKCDGCGHVFDDIVKYELRDDMQLCPVCKELRGKRVDTAHGFVYSQGRSFSRMRHGQ